MKFRSKCQNSDEGIRLDLKSNEVQIQVRAELVVAVEGDFGIDKTMESRWHWRSARSESSWRAACLSHTNAHAWSLEQSLHESPPNHDIADLHVWWRSRACRPLCPATAHHSARRRWAGFAYLPYILGIGNKIGSAGCRGGIRLVWTRARSELDGHLVAAGGCVDWWSGEPAGEVHATHQMEVLCSSAVRGEPRTALLH